MDTRRLLEDGRYPVTVRVAFGGKSKYLRIGKTYSMEEWVELCECEKQGRNKKAMERMSLKSSMGSIEENVNALLTNDDKFCRSSKSIQCTYIVSFPQLVSAHICTPNKEFAFALYRVNNIRKEFTSVVKLFTHAFGTDVIKHDKMVVHYYLDCLSTIQISRYTHRNVRMDDPYILL